MLVPYKVKLSLRTIRVRPDDFLNDSEKNKELTILKLLERNKEILSWGDKLLDVTKVSIAGLKQIKETSKFIIDLFVLDVEVDKSIKKHLSDSYYSKGTNWVFKHPTGVTVIKAHTKSEAIIYFLLNSDGEDFTNVCELDTVKGAKLIVKDNINRLKCDLEYLNTLKDDYTSKAIEPNRTVDLYSPIDITNPGNKK